MTFSTKCFMCAILLNVVDLRNCVFKICHTKSSYILCFLKNSDKCCGIWGFTIGIKVFYIIFPTKSSICASLLNVVVFEKFTFQNLIHQVKLHFQNFWRYLTNFNYIDQNILHEIWNKMFEMCDILLNLWVFEKLNFENCAY